MKTRILGLAIISLAAAACTKKADPDAASIFSGNIDEMQVPDGFNFHTSENVNVSIEVHDLDDQPLNAVKVNFYTADPAEGGKIIASAYTFNGKASSQIKVPSYLRSIFVQVAFPGFANSQTLTVQKNISAKFGGKPKKRTLRKSGMVGDTVHAGGNFYYIGSFDAAGVPAYLEVPGDNLTTQFLSDVNASFPESRPVPTYNPQYLATGNQMDVVLDDISDVYVTFVTEGAGYRNVLVYYVYDSNTPPAVPSDVDSLFVVFPNASFSGSGGGMYAGDKVHLGRLPAGKTISWALVANGWNTNGSLNLGAPVYYSDPALNTIESNVSRRQHSVQLLDNSRQLLLNGFEDLPRSGNSSDDDFNDLMFYVTATPWSAVEITNIPSTQVTYDQDSDGVPDDVDEFPNDPLKAYSTTYQGTLAYEDLWPAMGDYDFNDMVINYEAVHISDAANDVLELELDFTIRAVGSPFVNGFGFQLANLVPGDVQSVTGQLLTESIINNNANGTETNQQLATIMVFDNIFKLIANPGSKFINTVPGEVTANPEKISLSVSFKNPVNLTDLGLPPYNSFIIVKRNRGREVHLPSQPPTDLANPGILGSVDDDTDLATGKYYKTLNNLPWAIDITGSFDYPVEYESISDAYQNFAPWAMTGGAQSPDWFLDIPGYRDLSKLY